MKGDVLRVLTVSPWGAGGGYSGPITLLNRLFHAVAEENDMHVDLIYRDRGNEVVPEWPSNAVAIRAGSRTSFDRSEQMIWAIQARRIVRRRVAEYDYIYVHGAYLPSILPISGLGKLSARCAILPVLENGDLAVSKRHTGRIKASIQRKAISSATVAFALSDGIANELQEFGLPPSRIEALDNVVSSKTFNNASRHSPPHNSVRLGFVGRLGRIKQPNLVVESVSVLRDRGVDASATFIGPFESGDFEDEFRRLVRDLGLSESVKITGLVTDVTSSLIDEMDVFVLPSSSEGLPGALVEAMAAGLPCVVTDVGSMRYHVKSSRSGCVVTPDANAVADAVQYILTQKCLWSQMSDNAAVYGRQRFTASVVACGFVSALRRGLSAVESE